MWSAETVLVCALTLLGRSAASFPPIEFLTVAPPDVSKQAEAYVRVNDPHIYVITTRGAFQRLQGAKDRCADLESARKLASILIHEEVHARQTSDEKVAYSAQLTTLMWMGAGPGTGLYSDVLRSMQHALSHPRADTTRVMAMR